MSNHSEPDAALIAEALAGRTELSGQVVDELARAREAKPETSPTALLDWMIRRLLYRGRREEAAALRSEIRKARAT